jgi:putative pre-16S rRNA nuclease
MGKKRSRPRALVLASEALPSRGSPAVPAVLAVARFAYTMQKDMTTSSRAMVRDSSAASQESKPCRILAIDYGRKRIGLALSDELQLTAQPLQVFKRVNRREDLRRLRDICRKQGVARILVGHPLHISGEAGEMAEEAARFAARLRKELGIEVHLVDERLTSWEAAQLIAESGSSGRGKESSLDDVAAAIFLREYLERNRGRLQPVAGEKE